MQHAGICIATPYVRAGWPCAVCWPPREAGGRRDGVGIVAVGPLQPAPRLVRLALRGGQLGQRRAQVGIFWRFRQRTLEALFRLFRLFPGQVELRQVIQGGEIDRVHPQRLLETGARGGYVAPTDPLHVKYALRLAEVLDAEVHHQLTPAFDPAFDGRPFCTTSGGCPRGFGVAGTSTKLFLQQSECE